MLDGPRWLSNGYLGAVKSWMEKVYDVLVYIYIHNIYNLAYIYIDISAVRYNMVQNNHASIYACWF